MEGANSNSVFCILFFSLGRWKIAKKIFLYIDGLTVDVQICDLLNSKKENVLIIL